MKVVQPPAAEVISHVASDLRTLLRFADACFTTLRSEWFVIGPIAIIFFGPIIGLFQLRIELVVLGGTQGDLVLVRSPSKRNVNFQARGYLGAKVQDLVC